MGSSLRGGPNPALSARTPLVRLDARWRSRRRRTDNATVALTISLGAALGTVNALSRLTPDFLDESYFIELANNLVKLQMYSTNGLEPTAWKPPLEAIFLSPFVWLLGPDDAVIAARLCGLGLYLLSVLLFVSVCRRAGRPGVGLFVAVGLCLSPAGLVVATSLYPQVLVGFLVAFALWLATRDSRKRVTATVLGLLLGLAMLGHVTSAIPLAVIALWFGWHHDVTWRGRIGLMLLSAAATLASLAPWILRNALVMGKATLATGGGDNFLRGNSANTTPSTGVMVDLSDVVPPLPPGMSEASQDALYWRLAIDWIFNEPVAAACLFLRKLVYFFAASNSFLSQVGVGQLEQLALALSWFPVLLLAVARLIGSAKVPLNPLERLSVYSIVATAVGTAVFFTRVRYRVAIDPFVLILAGYGIALSIQRLAGRGFAYENGLVPISAQAHTGKPA